MSCAGLLEGKDVKQKDISLGLIVFFETDRAFADVALQWCRACRGEVELSFGAWRHGAGRSWV